MTAASNPAPHKAWYRILYLQVLVAVFLGILIGYFFPEVGKSLKPLGDGFIKLVKMIIAPIIFCTVVHGIASMSDFRKLGRIGGKTLLYFELVSTVALVIGLIVVNLLKPGVGFNIDPAALDPNIGRSYAQEAHGHISWSSFSTSSRDRSSTPSPPAIFSKSCSSPSWPRSPFLSWANAANRS